jgi:hypothetical protein
MYGDTEHSADERTDTESSLFELGAAVGDRAEPVDEEDGSAHAPGFHDDSPERERSSAGRIARRERDPARGED